ncbi:hypothetical protein DIU31_003100 [Mucilaginibacter rubeus]|uniref:DUF5723 domain-containing protein n=1 Tax=Mucilaginibacter rubeus TaxID=2027860 RepID=A0AAE6MGK0_9SPHI|nr:MULTISPECIES: hypothetical protein [Mucilaginibacter]QEM02553.1 hypothetical protein DIU31_003100 [Mucilaginibacter rubeus]QEM15173.1 hypothetical protein DIU38_003130 [Mucilaginibacter gossypii]QTE42103.1 hypothetical protein J3L19_24675 [Mucilaginibacter rubeus]QTE48704.1 hypothetical protein J3L21_24650 [Mucilaginibacter rubeus]QTE60089.1 hypothetical protein J3L23_16280 [Mucilaginibacter rubeus]
MKKYLLLMALIYSGCCCLHAQDLENIAHQKPVTFSGTIQAQGIFYNATGIQDRRAPFTYYFSGNPTISFYGLDVPLSFSFSQSDKSFRQPFNQFGISPAYKWVTVHLGYRDISFSPYTLGGHTMLGAGFELTPGKLRVGFMYGRLNRATTIDTTTQALVPFSFSRKGYAAKLGYGTDRNFFELSYLSAKDDTIKPKGVTPQQDYISPARNDVMGYTSRFSFFKYFMFESDGALSLYTNDVNSPISLDNGSSTLLNKLRTTFGLNGTSEYYTAFSAGLGYKSRNYGLKLKYKRVDPDFQTMGAYYFSSDYENWTVSPSANLAKGKIRFNGSLGFQHDNIKDQKRATNHRVIGAFNAGVDITKSLSVDAVYTNFSDNQKAQTVLFADSLKIVQTTQTITIMPRYMIISTDVIHMVSGSFTRNSLNDYNTFYSTDAVSRSIKTNQYMLSYNINFTKRMLSAYVNISDTKLSGQGMSNSFRSATAGANKVFFQKLQTGLSSTFTSSKSLGGEDTFIINATGNLGYRVTNKQLISFNLFLTNNKVKTAGPQLQPNFTETRGELSYLLSF